MENHIDPLNTDPGKNNPQQSQQAPPHAEHDYAHHENNPGPAPEAINERNDEGAGQALKWIIPPIILALIIFWVIYKL